MVKSNTELIWEHKNLCSKLQANHYLQGFRMKNEMMEDSSVTCTLGRYHVWAPLLSITLTKHRTARCSLVATEVRVDTLLAQVHPSLELGVQSHKWTWVHLSRTWLHGSKKINNTPHMSAEESLRKFPFWLHRKEGFLRGQYRAKA